ncbi:Mitogen-activated protein kinase 6 [Mactra antiquata]
MDDNQSPPPSSTGAGFKVDPRFINLQPISHGGNAVVYSATDSDCDKEVAIKKLSFCDRRGCKYALRELRLMRRLQHENVVTVYEVLGSNGYSLERGGHINLSINEMGCVYIVQELLHTDLHHLIQHEQLTAEHVRLFTYQLLRGLKYIHSANVLHRDLKPMNLLINVEDLILKIADFGLARVIDDEYSHKGFLTDNVGTCWYRSPELIISPRDYTKAIDIWSVGCILAEMLTGRPLFPGAHEMDQIGLILDTLYLSDNEWNKVTQILPQSFIRRHARVPQRPLTDRFVSIDIDALDLLEKLLVFEPSLRLSAEDALSHPYLQQYSCIEDEPIVLTPFHIEHEVDDLSPKTARKMISNEMSKSIETCGTRYMRTTNNDEMEEIPGDATSVECQNISSTETSSQSSKNQMVNADRENKTNDKNGGKSSELYDSDISNDVDKESDNKNIASNSDDVYEIMDSRLNIQVSDVRDITINAFEDSVDASSNTPQFNQYLCLESEMKHLQIVVDVPDEENMKEQISPKENKDSGTEKSKQSKDLENSNVDKYVVKVGHIQHHSKEVLPKDKDLVNRERRSEPQRTDSDIMDIIRLEKERMRQFGISERFKNGKRDKKKKRNRRNNRGNGVDEGQDFDTLYRLPTEHLTRHRSSICGKDRSVRTVEEQLRLHEELNERRKMVEMEKEHNIGAVGGYVEMEENIIQGRGSVFECGNISPTSEHSRDSSPTNEDVNVQRRFER